MKSSVAAILCAFIPVLLPAAWAFVYGLLDGFSLDCHGSAPGMGSGVASAALTVMLFSPAIMPCAIVGAFVGFIGVRRGVRQLLAMLTATVIGGVLIGAAGYITLQLSGLGRSAYIEEPTKYWTKHAIDGGFVGGSLGFAAAAIVAAVWWWRDRSARRRAEPGAAPDPAACRLIMA